MFALIVDAIVRIKVLWIICVGFTALDVVLPLYCFCCRLAISLHHLCCEFLQSFELIHVSKHKPANHHKILCVTNSFSQQCCCFVVISVAFLLSFFHTVDSTQSHQQTIDSSDSFYLNSLELHCNVVVV